MPWPSSTRSRSTPATLRGKKRTDWKRRPLQLTVRREDYPNADLLRWVNFSTQALVNELELQESTWEEAIKVQFEIDHRLNFDVLFCRFDKDEPSPHYRLTEQEPQLDLAAALARLAADSGSPDAPPVAPGAGASPFPAAFGRELGWTIGYTISDQETEPTILFKASTPFVNRLHLPDNRVKAGIVLPQATVEKFSANNRLKIYGQRASGAEWKYLGEIERPAKTTFNCQYQFSLDEEGSLWLHSGLVPYWETLDKHELMEQPGSGLSGGDEEHVHRCGVEAEPLLRDALTAVLPDRLACGRSAHNAEPKSH